MNMNEHDLRIMNRLQEHLICAQEYFPDNEWVGIFLVGSQNYGLDADTSDVDSKVIILPTLEDIALNRKPVSVTLNFAGGEHIEVKDIRLMFDCYRKQNINFLETLFTDFHITNLKWLDLFQPILDNNEKIARYNRKQAIDTMCGMIRERYKKFERSLSESGYDGKNASTIMRVSEFLDRYIAGESYAECLKSKDRETLLAYKRNLARKVEVCSNVTDAENRARGAAMYYNSSMLEIDESANEIMNSVLINIFRRLLSAPDSPA